jgi:hypothetical protein
MQSVTALVEKFEEGAGPAFYMARRRAHHETWKQSA